LSGPLSGRGCAPPYDRPRQPILPAIIVAAQPAIVVVATHHKILKQTNPLTDDLRDRIFDELGMDHVRAKISVALLHDPQAYAEQSVFLATESLKSFYLEVLTCRRGSIEVELRPAVIHEAARRAYDLLLSHQERVMQNSQTLQA
jgi:hypothetical protein